jgi:hypothetical protein
MIAGITHLTMEANLERGVDAGTTWGLGLQFRDEVALPASFERVEDDDHMLPLALLTGAGIKLEVVQHRRTSGVPGAYTGVFACRPSDGLSVRDRTPTRELLRRAGVVEDPVCVALPVPGSEAWFDASAASDGLAGIVCSVRDVPREAEFWTDFAKAKWGRVAADGAWGHLPSPLPEAFGALVLDPQTVGVPTRAGVGHAMNDQGFPSMGVLSTAVDVDCARAVDAGAVLRAAPITTTVDGRPLRMALIETPGGAPVELLSVAAGTRRLRSPGRTAPRVERKPAPVLPESLGAPTRRQH